MATPQLAASSVLASPNSVAAFNRSGYPNVIDGRFGTRRVVSYSPGLFKGLAVKASTTVAPKYTAIKPLADRVIVKIKNVEEKTDGGIFLPATAQTKPQDGQVVAVGDGKMIGKSKVGVSVKIGTHVIFSKYAGTEVEFNGSSHMILKEDDIVGVLETDDVKDLKPLSDRVFVKVEEAEHVTSGGLMLPETNKEKPSIGTVVAVGPGSVDDDGNWKSIPVSQGNTVLYSKYAGSDFQSSDGSGYTALRSSDVMAVLS